MENTAGTLDSLKKGLTALKKQVNERHNQIVSCISAGKPISAEEEEWLDNGGNLVEEVYVIDTLKKALDYERAYNGLEDRYKAAALQLLKLANGGAQVAGKKRKRSSVIVLLSMTANEHKGPEKKPKESMMNKDKHAATPVFTRKENATLRQRIEILDWHHKNNAKQKETATHFNAIWPNLTLKQPIISDWLRNEPKWRKQLELSNGSGSQKRFGQTLHPDVTDMLDLWLAKALSDNVNLTGDVLRQKWIAFANLAGVPKADHLSLSEGWLTRFKNRHGLKDLRRHGEAASATPEVVMTEQCRIQELIKEKGYQLQDIFNMDETGWFYAYVPQLQVRTAILLIMTIDCHQIGALLTSDTPVSKDEKSGSPTRSHQMQMARRN
jgi:hypothetical protein